MTSTIKKIFITNTQYLIFLLLFIYRTRKELADSVFSKHPAIKIKWTDLLKLCLRRNCLAEVTILDKRIQFNVRDIGDLSASFEVFLHRVYPLQPTRERATVFDIGAYSGFFALYCSVLWPNATIYCFEPDPDNFKNCALNLKLNSRLTKNISVFNIGFSNKDKEVKFYKYFFSAHNSIYKFYQPAIEIRVKLKSFKKYLDKINVTADLLKIDAEGAEYDILYPLSRKDFKKIKQVFVEIHSVNNTKKNEKALKVFLQKFYKKIRHKNNVYYINN